MWQAVVVAVPRHPGGASGALCLARGGIDEQLAGAAQSVLSCYDEVVRNEIVIA